MRLAVTFLVFAISALALFYFFGYIEVSQGAVNIDLGTTDITTTYSSFAIVSGLILGLLFSLAGLIGSGFRKGFFWILLFVFAVAGAVMFYFYVYQ